MQNTSLYQLVVFIPESHLEDVKNALFEAGAGKYQNYDRCSFEIPGTGQFRPNGKSTPFIGKADQIEQVKEYRVEMICPSEIIDATREALIKSHPYEEPAYHFIPIVI